MPRKLNLDIGDEFDKYERQLKDAEATRGRLLKAKERRDVKRDVLSKAAASSIATVQRRVKSRIQKFNNERENRQATQDYALGCHLEELMKAQDEKTEEIVKHLLDRRQDDLNLALQLQTVHNTIREDLETALKTKGPVAKKSAAETKKTVEPSKEPVKEEKDDIDMQDLFDFAMQVAAEAQQRISGEGSRTKSTERTSSVRGKRAGDVEGKRPAHRYVTIQEDAITVKEHAETAPKEREPESSLVDLKWTDQDMSNLAAKPKTDNRKGTHKWKGVEITDLDEPSSVPIEVRQKPAAETEQRKAAVQHKQHKAVAETKRQEAIFQTKQQKSSPLRTYSRKGSNQKV
ncbi:hypothetical protein QBC44DRAFT_148368 [Cladorrhinum sp. PSN332]|nr:hypothetical protein QBC44DRAFT_148368 [Cladorrhinum sp. PSN332]